MLTARLCLARQAESSAATAAARSSSRPLAQRVRQHRALYRRVRRGRRNRVHRRRVNTASMVCRRGPYPPCDHPVLRDRHRSSLVAPPHSAGAARRGWAAAGLGGCVFAPAPGRAIGLCCTLLCSCCRSVPCRSVPCRSVPCRLVPCHSDLPLGLPAAPRDVVQCACVSGIPRAGGIPRSALVYQPDMLPDRPYQVRIRLKCTYQPDILA